MKDRAPVQTTEGEKIGLWTVLHRHRAILLFAIMGAIVGALAGWAFLKGP